MDKGFFKIFLSINPSIIGVIKFMLLKTRKMKVGKTNNE